VQFSNVQASLDVTAKAANAVKRVQARIPTGDSQDVTAGSDTIPEYTIRSAKTICKRILVPNDPALSSYVVLDPSAASSASCQFIQNTIPRPVVSLSAVPNSVTVGSTTQLTWSQTGGLATDCATGQGSWNGPGPRPISGGPETSGALNTAGTTTF